MPDVRILTLECSTLSDILPTPVYICTEFDPQKVTKRNLKLFRGIWDTGASTTVITKKVVDGCNLKPIGMTKVKTARGEFTTYVYLVNLVLPSKVGFPNITVAEGELGNDIDVLIGMDIISKGDFAVTNKDNKTVVSFRVPSLTHIDFRKTSQPAQKPSKGMVSLKKPSSKKRRKQKK